MNRAPHVLADGGHLLGCEGPELRLRIWDTAVGVKLVGAEGASEGWPRAP